MNLAIDSRLGDFHYSPLNYSLIITFKNVVGYIVECGKPPPVFAIVIESPVVLELVG